MIKQGLQIKLGQSLSMTPQLQQAIRLLQLSNLELQQEIQQALNSNPLLEESADDTSLQTESNESESSPESSIEENLSSELEADTSWDETYDMSGSDSKVTNSDNQSSDNSNLLETLNAEITGLKEHLTWQINSSNLSIQDKIIAATIIDSLNDKGFLTESVEDIYSSLSHQLLIELDEVIAILHYIQHLDPLGVAARDLQECLLIQLKQLYSDHDLYQKASQLLEKDLDLLEKRDYIKIKRMYQLSDKEYEKLISMLRSLNPNPGDVFEIKTARYITPDVFVTKTHQGRWIATLNQDNESKLRVNEYYKNMIPTANTNDKKYLKDNLQNARWFIKALENRDSTILNVANEIIKRQFAFLKYGDQAMKPMILKDIADDLGLNESTISRVSTKKYMHTPHGIYELKYFFSSHVSTNTGGECSSTAIRAMIRELIKGENTKKPLSDNKLTNLLEKQGIEVARRTVAKYREGMTIPSSRERKSLA
jgi:RNA polymerase sigma-54 factor